LLCIFRPIWSSLGASKIAVEYYCTSFVSFFHQWLHSPLLGSPLFFSFVIFFTQTVGLHGRVISPSQGRYLHTEQHKQTSMSFSGIWIHYPRVRTSHDNSCLRAAIQGRHVDCNFVSEATGHCCSSCCVAGGDSKWTATCNHDRKIRSCVVFIKVSMASAEPLRRDCKSNAYAVRFNCKMASVCSGPYAARPPRSAPLPAHPRSCAHVPAFHVCRHWCSL
jgi:hypothetical protein